MYVILNVSAQNYFILSVSVLTYPIYINAIVGHSIRYTLLVQGWIPLLLLFFIAWIQQGDGKI